MILSINNIPNCIWANQGQLLIILGCNFLICKIRWSDYMISQVPSNLKNLCFVSKNGCKEIQPLSDLSTELPSVLLSLLPPENLA